MFKQKQMNKSFVRKGALLCAGPTAGKSTLLTKVRKRGVSIIDTDEVTTRVLPEFFELKAYSRGSAERNFFEKSRDLAIASEIRFSFSEKHLIISNLWGPLFLANVLGAGVKPSLYIGRISGERISELARSRKSAELPPELTNKWVTDAFKYAPSVFEHVIWLPNNLYLSDVVRVEGNQWVITELGRRLLDVKPDQVTQLSAVMLQQEGESNV